MAIDQTNLGEQVAALMEEIENAPDMPSEGAINRSVLIVEVTGPGPNEGEQVFGLRVSSSASPHVSIGFIEVAKAMQMQLIGF